MFLLRQKTNKNSYATMYFLPIYDIFRRKEIRGYLKDTCLSVQDKYKAYLDYFEIKYKIDAKGGK